jgi:EAL domain-containing protein (putative c-di-GMP-specific phosphodiesterase class I)
MARASAVRIKVIAEDVEAREQVFFVQPAGVDAVAGWVWSRGVSPHRLVQWAGSLQLGAGREVVSRRRSHAGY